MELTESAILHDVDAATQTMRQLASKGVHFALDDFGMEHSALSHLSNLPFDTLKIDRSFVARITEDRAHAALFQAIISMIHSLGMTAVAEGVEAPSQLIYLQAYGCDILQGYLFSRPLPPEEFQPMLTAGMVVPSLDHAERGAAPGARSRRGLTTRDLADPSLANRGLSESRRILEGCRHAA